MWIVNYFSNREISLAFKGPSNNPQHTVPITYSHQESNHWSVQTANNSSLQYLKCTQGEARCWSSRPQLTSSIWSQFLIPIGPQITDPRYFQNKTPQKSPVAKAPILLVTRWPHQPFNHYLAEALITNFYNQQFQRDVITSLPRCPSIVC